MPFYNYSCKASCKAKSLPKAMKKTLAVERQKHPKGILVWTVQHGMNDKPEIKCPICSGLAEQTMFGFGQQFYIKGNAYLNRGDIKRQQNLHLLETGQDPYGYMRQPGEVDELVSKLRKKKIKRK